MKKNLMRMVAATLMFCCAANVQAAGDETNGHAYFTKAELPDMTKILPPFPAFESARFVAGSVLYQLIRNHERFIGQLARARAEFKEKTGESTPVNSARIVPITEGSAYTLQGTPATASTRGIVIEGSQKVVRK